MLLGRQRERVRELDRWAGQQQQQGVQAGQPEQVPRVQGRLWTLRASALEWAWAGRREVGQ
jgi:hypothetical protein